MVNQHAVNVLLVEDSEDDAFFFRWALRKCDVPTNLVHVTDGAAALQRLRQIMSGAERTPDIVFLDLKIPSFSGFEILEWLKQQPGPQRLNVVILSGSEHAGDMARAKSLGAERYFVKPISCELLNAALQEVAPRESSQPA
jgi:CheY-like chemotaxis protein